MNPLQGPIGALLLCGAAALGQNPAPAAPAPPTITLYERHGHLTPTRAGFTHTGGGNTDVAQPTPDTVIITMGGVVVAGGHPCKDSAATLQFDLNQCFEVVVPEPKTSRLKLVLEARAIGLFRSQDNHCTGKGPGSAEMSVAHAAVSAESGELLSVGLSPHSVAAGENLSINDHAGPCEVVIAPGKYSLHQAFVITAAHPRSLLPCKPASAEFAPDPALDPLWISYWEPFHGAIKKDFGFQVIMKLAPATGDAAGSTAAKLKSIPDSIDADAAAR